jgi:hypothetical protein
MKDVITFIIILLAIYGQIMLIKQFKLAAIISYWLMWAAYITTATMVIMGDKISTLSWIFLVWMTLAVINDLLSIKGYSTMQVIDIEKEIKEEIEKEKRWDDMINGEWFKNFTKNLNNIIDAE